MFSDKQKKIVCIILAAAMIATVAATIIFSFAS